MRGLGPSSWWQAGLMYGTAMFAWYVMRHAIHGGVTLQLVAREFLIWEAAGIVFGLLLTAVMSILFRRNLFRTGFPDKRRGR